MKKEIREIIENCEEELIFKTSRSGGAGGQHVNKVETRVTLRWNIQDSKGLSSDQKSRLLDKLSNYINKEGVFIISDESSRSQLSNKQNTILKWSRLINKAFYEAKKRKRSKPSKAAKAKMRTAREKRSAIKAARQYKPNLDD
jgi:ribosome-associated protein